MGKSCCFFIEGMNSREAQHASEREYLSIRGASLCDRFWLNEGIHRPDSRSSVDAVLPTASSFHPFSHMIILFFLFFSRTPAETKQTIAFPAIYARDISVLHPTTLHAPAASAAGGRLRTAALYSISTTYLHTPPAQYSPTYGNSAQKLSESVTPLTPEVRGQPHVI